jgi:hypothetical protein
MLGSSPLEVVLTGSVTVGWSLEDEGLFLLTWCRGEYGMDNEPTPLLRGFGGATVGLGLVAKSGTLELEMVSTSDSEASVGYG